MESSFADWFQSTTSGNLLPTSLWTPPPAAVATNTFILIHNMASGGDIDVKGYRLTENFVTIFGRQMEVQGFEAHKLSYFNIEEVEPN